MRIFYRKHIFFVLLFSILFAKPVFAVPPPDFIFNIGSQLAYVFSAAVVILSAVFSVVYQYVKVRYHAIKMRPWLFISVVVLIGLVSVGATYGYNAYKQNVEYEKWLVESEEYAAQENSELSENSSEEDLNEDDEDTDNEDSDSQKGYSVPEISEDDGQFWEEHGDMTTSISNADFDDKIHSGDEDFVILDTRENVEYEYGHMEGSTHIRYADLYDGDWVELPKDAYIYVLCWSGMRGLEVAEFLRSHELVALYLEEGVDGWVDFGGGWIGEIKFLNVYEGDQYSYVFSTEEIATKVAEGAILVDAREPDKFASYSPASINIPLMHTPSEDLEAAFDQVPDGSTFITVCDEYTNCFMAKLVGVELERRGHTFLGRYNKPWDY